MSLEFLRRTAKEYDQYLLRQHQRSFESIISPIESNAPVSNDKDPNRRSDSVESSTNRVNGEVQFRPSILQQMTRAFLHMLQFTVAYFIMLLAMYFNGYIIISIIIGGMSRSFISVDTMFWSVQ